MGSALAARARRYLADARRAFERAPVEVSVAVVVAAAFSYAIETGGQAFTAWAEIAICGLLMLYGAWAATLLHALSVLSRPARWGGTLAIAALVGGYGIWLIDLQLGSQVWRAAMLIAAALAGLVAVPYFGRRPVARGASPVDARVLRMRVVTGRVLLRVIGALLYCAALFAGLALALGAVNTLFELGLQGEIYAHVAGWIFFALAPWIVAGGLDGYVADLDERNALAGVVHRMSAFLVPPLLALYTLILYAYTVRIVVTGEVPKNIVSPLVFAAGVLALLALLLFDPRGGGTAGERTLRAAPPLFVPLAALGAWTIALRVEQYGWTEFRLLRLILLLVLGALALGAAVQVLRRQRLRLHVAPLALAAVLVLAAVGPWSVQALSRSSQQARLERALLSAGIDPAGAVPPADTARVLTAGQYDAIEGSARYLTQHHGTAALPPVFARVRGSELRSTPAWALGLRRAEPVARGLRYVSGRLEPGGSWNVGGVVVQRVWGGARHAPAEPGNVMLESATRTLRIRAGGQAYTVDAAPLIEWSQVDGRAGSLPADQAALTARDEAGAERGTLLLFEVTIEIGSNDIAVLRVLDGLLLLLPDARTAAAGSAGGG